MTTDLSGRGALVTGGSRGIGRAARLRRRDLSARIPVGRVGTAEEVAQAVLMVLANGYMTGQTIQVNGGLHFT